MRRGPWAATTLALALLALTACAEASPDSSAPAGSASVSASPAADRSADPRVVPPAAFTARSPLASCGTYDDRLRRPSDPPPPDGPLGCLERALASDEGAELVIDRNTVEGDGIATYVRALPGGSTVEVFTDSTADRFGTQVWSRQTCTGFVSEPLGPTGCSEPVDYLARPIEGTWNLRDEEQDYAVTFDAGIWTGASECRASSGSYRVDETGRILTSGPGPATTCVTGDVGADLIRTARVIVTLDRLRFLDSDGHIVADLVPALPS